MTNRLGLMASCCALAMLPAAAGDGHAGEKGKDITRETVEALESKEKLEQDRQEEQARIKSHDHRLKLDEETPIRIGKKGRFSIKRTF